MESFTRYLPSRAVAAAVLAALVLVPALPAARAEVVQASCEPWYRQVPTEARQRALALFAQAVDKHQQILRGEALELYEQALAQCDHPDIRWNLALVLEELGQYLRAHEQLESALRWGAELGPERLREIRGRLRALETQRLARIETDREEPGAAITLDGKPWLRQAGRRSAVVLPGEHYMAASKLGYFPVTRSVVVKAGEQARVMVPMDADRIYETRRWSAWKPWTVTAAGIAVAAAGAALEQRAFADQHEFERKVAQCTTDAENASCDASQFSSLSAAVQMKNRLAIGMLASGGITAAIGLALTWLNRPAKHRSEPRSILKIDLTPILSSHEARLSALVRF